MDIMTMLWRWRSKAQDDDGHIMSHILIACDVYFLYDPRVIEERHVNYFTLLLNALVIEVEVVVGVTTS